VRHLKEERGFSGASRHAQKDAFPDDHVPSPSEPFERLTRLLKKRKGVSAQAQRVGGKSEILVSPIVAEDRGLLVQRLFDDGFVTESGKSLMFASTRFRGV